MYCKKCGSEIPEGASFCGACGEKVNNSKKKSKKTLVIVLIVCIFGTFIGGGYYFLGKENVSEKGLMSYLKSVKGKEYLALVRNSEGKYGYINQKWEEIIPCQYDVAFDFTSDGYAVVGVKNGKSEEGLTEYKYKFGIINAKGEKIVPCKYESIEYANEYLGEKTLITTNRIYNNDYGITSVLQENEWTKMLPRMFDEHGLVIVSVEDGTDEDGIPYYKYGYINKDGMEVIPCRYDMVEMFQSNGLALVRKNDDEASGFINTDGKEVISCEKYEFVSPFSDSGLAKVEMEFGEDEYGDQEYLCGYINERGQEVIPMIYGQGENFVNGFACVQDRESKLWGAINEQGEQIIACKYEELGDFGKNGLAGYRENEFYGLVNQYGEELTPARYNSVFYCGKGLTALDGDEGYTLVDGEGNIALECGYDFVFEGESPNIIEVGLENEDADYFTLYGTIDMDGEELIPATNQVLMETKSDLWSIRKIDGRCGIYNKDGDIILATKYDYVDGCGDNDMIAAGISLGTFDDLDDKYQCAYFDTNGKEIKTLPENYIYAGCFVQAEKE